MRRIAVIGNGGGGKSTLCRRIGAELGLAVFVIDRVQWKPGWVAAPIEEVRAVHDTWLRQDGWIIDGWGDWAMLTERFAAADTVVFVDFPLWRHYWWATKRMIASRCHRLPDEPEGCSYAKVPWRMYQTLWRVHWQMRPKLLELLATCDDGRVVRIHHPRELHAFARVD